MLKALLITLAIISVLAWSAVRGYNYIDFNRQCEGHLKRAADANSTELAAKELTTALKFIEDNNMTEGYTSIIYTTPDEDVGFWYTNLKTALDELNAVDDNSTQLEKSNILMKLRETLLDDGDNGMVITTPEGISIFPHNVLYCILILFTVVLCAVSGIIILNEL